MKLYCDVISRDVSKYRILIGCLLYHSTSVNLLYPDVEKKMAGNNVYLCIFHIYCCVIKPNVTFKKIEF